MEEISKRLVKRGFEVEVLTIDTTGELESKCVLNGVKIRRFESWQSRKISEVYYPSGMLKQYLLKNSNKYDIVHAHNYHALPALYAAQTKSSNKFVFTPHYHGEGSYFFRNLLHIPYKFFLGRGIFESADRVICVSNYEKNLVLNNIGVDEKKVTVIPNGVDLDEFKDILSKPKSFRSILYVGRLEKYKGIQYILKALPRLDEDFIVEIVGVGPYKAELIELATNLGVDSRVRFYENLSREQLLQKYVDADVFVILSLRESYGICVAEALSSGTPCIVLNSSALREWVDENSCFGIDYPPNIDVLVKLIRKVIGKIVDYKGIRKRVPSWNYVAEKVSKIYESFYEEPSEKSVI